MPALKVAVLSSLLSACGCAVGPGPLPSPASDADEAASPGGAASDAAEASHWRRECEEKIALNHRDDAVLACSAALERAHTGPNVRRLVAALVGGPTPPTATHVAEALILTAKERENPVGRATAAAAACEIAERIGDVAMLDQCAGELEQVAPGDPTTGAARRALDSLQPRWRFWFGWLVVATTLAATIIDAIRGYRRARRRVAVAASALLAGAACSVVAASAHADQEAPPRSHLSRWPIDVEHPERGVPSEAERNAEPLEFGYWLQDVAQMAEHASTSGDHATSARLYGALATAVPDRAVSFVKMCQEYEALGELGKAMNACGDALLRDGTTVADYSRFVALVLSKPGSLSAKEIGAVDQVLSHMRADPAGRVAADDLDCAVGARTADVTRLEECTAALSARAPSEPKTLVYRWALAVARGNSGDAERLRAQAEAAGVGPEDLARMEDVARAHASTQHRRFWLELSGAALLVVAFALVGAALLKKRPSSPAAAAPVG